MAGEHQEADSYADSEDKEAASRHFLEVVVHGINQGFSASVSRLFQPENPRLPPGVGPVAPVILRCTTCRS